jgi:hypothetical protein
MKAHTRIRRAVRALALTGCLSAALAAPTIAGAVPINGGGEVVPVNSYHPHGHPDAAALGKAQYTLPHGFQSDAGSATRQFSLPSSFRTDAQTKSPAVTTVPAAQTPVLRSDSDHTLAIVLASAALGIALCGTGYAALRVTRIQRRLVGSSS